MALSPFFGFERDPFAVMRRLQDEVDRAVTSPARAAGGFPAVNIWQGTDSAALTAELSGVDPADIDISVKEDVVTITGERKPPATDEQTVWHRRERALWALQPGDPVALSGRSLTGWRRACRTGCCRSSCNGPRTKPLRGIGACGCVQH